MFSTGNSTQSVRSEGDYVTINNIEVSGCTGYGINLFGANSIVQNSYIYNFGLGGSAGAGVKISGSAAGHAQNARVTQTKIETDNGRTVEVYGVLINADYAQVDHNEFKRISNWNATFG